jgi:hypothetical protein
VVLVDDPAEQIPSTNVTRTDGDRVPRFGQRWGEAERAMRALPVVVLDIGPEDGEPMEEIYTAAVEDARRLTDGGVDGTPLRGRGFRFNVMFWDHASTELRESASKFVAMDNFFGYLAVQA